MSLGRRSRRTNNCLGLDLGRKRILAGIAGQQAANCGPALTVDIYLSPDSHLKKPSAFRNELFGKC